MSEDDNAPAPTRWELVYCCVLAAGALAAVVSYALVGASVAMWAMAR